MFEEPSQFEAEESSVEIEESPKLDYYETLGVVFDASQDEIKKAFYTLSKTHHPDIGGDAEKFKSVSEAYATLKDPEKRKEYDEILRLAAEAKKSRFGAQEKSTGADDIIEEVMKNLGKKGEAGEQFDVDDLREAIMKRAKKERERRDKAA